MDLSLIEQELKRIRDRKKEINTELNNIKQQYSKIENISNSDWWYVNNDEVYAVNNGSQLTVEMPTNNHLYISYLEKNNDFSISPQKPIVFTESDLDYVYTGSTTNNLKSTLYLVGYKNNKKVRIYNLNLNENAKLILELDKIDCFRIAIKLTGTGTFSLESIKIGDYEIKGFNNIPNYEGLLKDESPTLNVEKQFTDIINLDSNSINVPSRFKPFLRSENDSIKSNLKGRSYGYIQYEDVGPIFDTQNAPNFLEIDNNNLYEFGFSAMTVGNTKVELVLLGLNEEEIIEANLVKLNSVEPVKFKDETKFVKLLLRITGSGEIMSLKVGVNKQEKLPNYSLNFSLEPNKWLNPKNSNVKLQYLENQMIISSFSSNEKAMYISYDANNNSFSKVPENSVFHINYNCNYEIIVNGEENGNGSIQPIIITYSNEKKEEILTLPLNEMTKIKFKKDVEKVRISFKVSGSAQLRLNEFIVKEFYDIEKKTELNWLDSKEPLLLGLTKKQPLSKVKMAAIFDEFTLECYSNECDLITFSPDNWKEILTVNKPDLLMVESAWRGNGGTWTKKVQYTGEESIKELEGLINWCNQNNIPTVFWNKEDPVHYEYFIETAKLFDFVFTSDENMVPVYKEACGHERVSSLMFAAQPKIHNPITIGERKKGVSFAGSFYKKHKERSEDMLKIFDQALNHNLAIYDRNYEKIKQGLLPNNRFPEYLEPYIKGSLKYYEIDKAYKGYKAVININTVKNSPTMFARRVFEALASGTPVISNYSEGIKQLFRNIVYASDDEEGIRLYLSRLFVNEEEYKRTVLNGIREVLGKHTYTHRLEQIIDFVQLPFKKEETCINVFAFANNQSEYDSIINMYKKQNIDNKKLIIILPAEEFNNIREKHLDSDISIYEMSTLFKHYSNITELVEGEYFTILSHEEVYKDDYLMDLVLATLYAPWEVISSNPKNELVFEQFDMILPYRSIFKVDLFKTKSLDETFEMVTSTKKFSLAYKMGARILKIPD